MKNTSKKYASTILICFISISNHCWCQKVKTSLQASINYNFIPDVVKIEDASSYIFVSKWRITEKYQGKPGGKINFNMDIRLKNNFFIKAGLGVNLLRYNKNISISNTPSDAIKNSPLYDLKEPFGVPRGGPLPKINTEIIFFGGPTGRSKANLIYTEFSIAPGYRLLKEKLCLSIGGTTSVLANSLEEIEEVDFTNKTKYYRNKSKKEFSNILFSLNGMLTYRVLPRITIFSSYSKQLNSLYKKDKNVNYHLVELGLEYMIR